MSKQNKKILLVATLIACAIVALVLFALPSATVLAQTATPTNTPTNTATPTTTPFAISGNASVRGTYLCRLANVDCVQVRNGGNIHFYSSNGSNTITLNGSTGAISAQSLSVTTPMAVLAYQTPGVRMKCSTDTITGTQAIAHGMATPQYVNANLGADVNGDHARVSFTNASATVTIKVWNSALTPAAAQTPVAVDWCVVGVP